MRQRFCIVRHFPAESGFSPDPMNLMQSVLPEGCELAAQIWQNVHENIHVFFMDNVLAVSPKNRAFPDHLARVFALAVAICHAPLA